MEDKDMRKKKKNIIIINDKGEMLSVTKKTLDGNKDGEDMASHEEVKEMNGEEDTRIDTEEKIESTGEAFETKADERSHEKECSESKECCGGPKNEEGQGRKETMAEENSKNDPEEEFIPLDSKEPGEKAESVKSPPKESGDVFVPPMLKTTTENANKEIFEERDKGEIVAEGWIWKKRRIFSCFWHQKYFVLTKDGTLKYYKADGRRHAKGNWNMKESTEIRHYNLSSEENTHPCRIMVFFSDHSFLLAFDERNTKDYWVEKLNRAIGKPRK
ncbi:putative protein kinase domain-containing [Encephalitozoon romaleae SJ-2008]|uniref:PH domain-containing protein n=1 Tax=Encephalitozoon romaleae (strain SJ-2008) TaxID=1178016 RepID=I7AET3_ENCRO|nr:putative protein kinase domain-containing [Encephalitozoon romaleae SJ-2008]AFN83155.1 putative protein kinase domain-containing [Encephalitozoon romaleae SJ-2008]